VKAVQLKGGAENIVNGVAKAEPVRGVNKKRKIAAEDEGRMSVSFSSSTQQSTIEENWGESKITPKQQANINFYLLRFIVCCFVAFSLLDSDSGFFIDFVFALYVMPPLFSFNSGLLLRGLGLG
jgi:hypothetical protein